MVSLRSEAVGAGGASHASKFPVQEADFAFELGGPAYRLMRRCGLIKDEGPSLGRRIIAFICITWIPLLIFAILDGHALGTTPRASLLLDFATYARLFIAVPLIFAAEIVVGPRIRKAGLRLLEAEIIRPESYPDFVAAVARANRRRDAYLPEVCFIVFAIIGAQFFTLEQMTGLGATSWHTNWVDGELRLSLSGLWYRFVVTPLIQFFVLRWIWRLVIWTLFLRDIARLPLDLCATHTDMSAGLGFLGMAHVSMAIFPFAFGCVICAEIAFRAHFEGLNLAALEAMAPVFVAYISFVELATFGPLLVLLPLLARTRREALRSYGILVQQHNRLFHIKWIEGDRPPGETPLGNPDMSSLVDLGSSYAVIRQMNIVPFSITHLIRVAIISCLPGMILIFQILPFTEALKLIAGTVM